MKHTIFVSRIAIMVLLVCLAASLCSADGTFTWTAAGGDGTWQNPANWSGGAGAAPVTTFNTYPGWTVNIPYLSGTVNQVNLAQDYSNLNAFAAAGTLNVDPGVQVVVPPSGYGGLYLQVTNGMNNAGEIVLNGGTAANLSGALYTGASLNYGATISLGTAFTGGGTITLNNGGQLAITASGGAPAGPLDVINQTIRGTGAIYEMMTVENASIIDANGIANGLQTNGTLALSGVPQGGITNNGTMQASGGGVLALGVPHGGVRITQGVTGVIQALDGSTVYLGAQGFLGGTDFTTINGGSLNAVGTGQLIANNVVLQNFNLTGTLSINKDLTNSDAIGGNIKNTGVINFVGGAGSSLSLTTGTPAAPGEWAAGTPMNLTGGGTFQLNGGTVVGDPAAVSPQFTSDNVIRGSGAFSMLGVSFTNQGTVLADTGNMSFVDSAFTNNGTVRVTNGNALAIYSLTNYSGNTLTGGTYDVSGTLSLIYPNGTPYPPEADIHTNAATLILDGPNYFIGDASTGTKTYDLANFWDNASGGTLTIENGASFTSAGDFTNEGTLDIAKGSSLTVGPGGTGTFTEAAGSTTIIDGSLSAGALAANGSTSASGTVNSSLSVGGTLTVGDDPATLNVIGNYTQTGTLDIEVGMILASLLNVTGNVTLDSGSSILDLTSWGTWLGPENRQFIIMEWTGTLTGWFSQITLPTVAGYHFELQPVGQAKDLQLDVTGPVQTPEPDSWLLLAVMMTPLVGLGKVRRLRRRRS